MVVMNYTTASRKEELWKRMNGWTSTSVFVQNQRYVFFFGFFSSFFSKTSLSARVESKSNKVKQMAMFGVKTKRQRIWRKALESLTLCLCRTRKKIVATLEVRKLVKKEKLLLRRRPKVILVSKSCGTAQKSWFCEQRQDALKSLHSNTRWYMQWPC